MKLRAVVVVALLAVTLSITFVSEVECLAKDGTGAETKDGTTDSSLALSHPDIYPDEEFAIGELTVHIVENAKESDTFYTLDGTDPSPSANPNAVRYTTPLHFSTPGMVWLRCRAVPSAFQLDGIHISSLIMEKKYTIKATNLSPPVAQPRGGYYRGQVIIDVKPGTKGTDTSTSATDVNIRYLWKDANKQGEATVTKDDTWTSYSEGHIRNEKVGKHFLFLQSTKKSDTTEKSPVSRFTYYITSPLVYDVSTECAKCDGKPTANEFFTVSVQNANAESWMFLSYSQRCDIATKIVGTARMPVDRHSPSAKFRAYEAAPAVFVCLEEGGSPVPLLPRNAQNGDKHFAVARSLRDISSGDQKKAIEDAAKQDAEQGSPRYDSNGVLIKNVGNSSSTSGGSIGFFVMFILATGIIIYLVRVSRTTGSSVSQLHKAVVDDVQRLVGKKGDEAQVSNV